MSRDVPSTGTLFAVVLAVALAASAGSALAATYTFRVLSASETYSTTATRGCVSGRRDFTGSTTGAVPDDPAAAFTPVLAKRVDHHEGRERLAADLESGAWDESYGHLREKQELNVGLRLVVAELN
jgi:hypothetical protein